ncbi:MULTISPECIES: phosphate ABC transporter permease PstA [Campylobacter]|uniref:phosphate ABC transporter permease PstA n=1 Tax=Campylobacter TaxID=194 RepID=UPI002AD499BB|nr:phosphate ABC transporter permease PstA [Campylobacter sp. RM12916]
MKITNSKNQSDFELKELKIRHFKGRVFKFICSFALLFCVGFLAIFLYKVASLGAGAFSTYYLKQEILITENLLNNPRDALPRQLHGIVSRAWFWEFGNFLQENKSLINTKREFEILLNANAKQYLKNQTSKLSAKNMQLLDELREKGLIVSKFNKEFFLNGDSKIPEAAGVLSSIVGTMLTMFVAMVTSVPIAIASAIYIEEFLKDGKFKSILQVNINNLAAVPSILFGLLGLGVFVNLFGLARGSALAGGLTLSLMSLPIVIVSTTAALKAVPNSIRQAGMALGISKVDVVKDHVLPSAFGGILTGSIISLAQIIGETAPLIIIGMIAFVPQTPTSLSDATTVIPAQIFSWASMPEFAYVERTNAAILVLLALLLVMNLVAFYLRKKYQKKG